MRCAADTQRPPSLRLSRRYPTAGWTQYRVLQARALKAYSRNPANVAGRTSMSIFLGIVGGLVFLRRGSGGYSKP